MMAGGLLSACFKGPPMPAMDGAVIEVRRSKLSLASSDPLFDETLQISWFGSACHLIQLGEVRVLTDPFVTNGFRVFSNVSDPKRVEATLGHLSPPQAILVNHAHFDHFLDAHAALVQEEWAKAGVPLYGGPTCKNLLAGFQTPGLLERCHSILQPGVIINRSLGGGKHLRVTAFASKHSPHFECGLTLANGVLTKPLSSPPLAMTDFPTGEVFNYLIELSAGGKTFTVFYLGGFFDLGKFPDSLPPIGTHIDVAILTAASHLNVPGYPEEHLARLRPRHIVLNHFNTFMAEKPDEQLAILGRDFVKLGQLTRDVQATFARAGKAYPEFEAMHIPAITRMEAKDRGRNVLLLR
jgi:L-ascorbate metabolism protein UlaG (beta-lactamase superfamily)